VCDCRHAGARYLYEGDGRYGREAEFAPDIYGYDARLEQVPRARK